MSHQTGIKANEELKKFFGKCRDGKVRVFKISIDNEQLSLASHKSSKGNWEQDYDKMILPLLEAEQPCYILYRLDTKANNNYEWLLVSWSPEDSPVRQKMLYASTKATLKQEFGAGQIKDELFGTAKEDVSFKGFQNHMIAAKAPAPLTYAEEELKELKKFESVVTVGVDSRQQTIQGVAFPVTNDAKSALIKILNGDVNYVRLKIDVEHEKIHLDDVDTIKVNELGGKVSTETPQYHLIKFKHSHEGDYMESNMFIYSMPGYKCSVKERMLYSSCKAPLLNIIENELGIEISKKMEVDSGDELTEANLKEELHPTKNLHRPQFAKPKGPPNRGAKRLTKGQNNDN